MNIKQAQEILTEHCNRQRLNIQKAWNIIDKHLEKEDKEFNESVDCTDCEHLTGFGCNTNDCIRE